MSDSSTEAKRPKRVIEIRYNSVGKDFPYKPEETVAKLLEKAIAEFGASGAVHTLALFNAEGEELRPEHATLVEAKVKVGDVLRLRTSKVKGGAELVLGEGLLTQTLSILRECGAREAECVCFWTGPVTEPGVASTVLHPEHHAGRGGYEVDEAWLSAMWDQLEDAGLQIRAQVHTHPEEAFHSRTDDAYPILATIGFLSLVIPRFAAEPQTLQDAFLGRLERDGSFTEIKDVAVALGIEAH